LFDALFYLLFVLLVSGRYNLDAAIFNNIQDLKEDIEQQLAMNSGNCSLTMLILYAFSL
jgi:hypothetical protein